jgi:hypothetical protein
MLKPFIYSIIIEMKRNKLPPTISLEFLLNECKKQEEKDKKIKYIDGGSDEILQIGLKDN